LSVTPGHMPSPNNITMDVMSCCTWSLPQDAVRSLLVITNSYDLARGQFSGGLVASATRGGTNVPQGSFTYALRDRSLEWGEVTSSPFGQGMTQNQLGGGMGGPIVPNKLFVFAALQGRWRGQLLPSLVSADPGTLAWLGVNPDSAARFVTLASATGAPVTVSGLSGDRATNNTLGLLRLDWQASDVHTLTLRLDGNWESQEPTRVGSLALPATGGTRTTRGGGVMASLTSFFGGRFINELRGYVARQRRDATALLTLPSGFVDVTSALPTGGQTVVALAFGGNSGLPQHTNTGSLALAGARRRAARFSGAPRPNRAVDSLFGGRTDRIPSEVHVSPRLGFTWAWGDGSDGPQTTFLRGGVGDFRSLTPTALYAAALSAPG